MATAIVVAVVSCKKDNIQQTTNNTEQSLQNSDNMDEYLKAFKKKLLTAEKGGETISLEQAQRDLGNLLNFDFGDANYATDVFKLDTIHAKLTVTADGQVDLSQLAVTYGTLLDEILDTYHQIDIPEKSVYAISCGFNEMASKDGEEMDVEIVLTTRGYRGVGPDTNEWRPNNRGGTCDGQYLHHRGGPEIVEDCLNNEKIIHACCEFGRMYYTDEGSSMRAGRDTYNPSIGGYDIYLSPYPYYMECLSHDSLMWYCNRIWSYWTNRDFVPTPPADREAMRFEIHYGPAYPYSTTSMWTVIVEYAKPNCTGTGPIVD